MHEQDLSRIAEPQKPLPHSLLLGQEGLPVAGHSSGGGEGLPITSQPGTAGPAGGGGPAPGGMQNMMFVMLLVLLGMILLSTFAGRKERKKREALLNSLARHDRVQTAGGIIGTIVEVKGDEIVIKVDESTNTRIHFARSAVTGVLKKSSEPSEPQAVSA